MNSIFKTFLGPQQWKRWRFLWLGSSIATIFSLGSSETSAATQATSRPNVLLIVCDDLNTRIGCYGDTLARTPNIDKLAKRGMRFERAYAQYPVCNPSRSSFMSGLRPETSGVMDQQSRLKEKKPNVIFLPEHFSANGYFTAAIGKVEHGSHSDMRWDLKDTVSTSDDDEGELVRSGGRRANSATPTKRETGLPYLRARATDDERDPENVDTRIAEKVVKIIESKRPKPFFIVVGFHKPHVPHVAPKKFFDLYPRDKMPLVHVPADDAKDIPLAALAAGKNYQPNMPDEQKRGIMASYMACVSYVDEQTGIVIDSLERAKLWNNTIVVFTSDHGWHFGEHGWWAKASLFEPSARVPLIIVASGFASGKVSPRVVELLDLFPTLTELCGLPVPPQGEGKSFTALLKNPRLEWNKPAFTTERRPRVLGRSVRTERFRYTEWDDGRQGVELYDHDKDPNEFTNLASDPRFQETITELKNMLHASKNTATRP